MPAAPSPGSAVPSPGSAPDHLTPSPSALRPDIHHPGDPEPVDQLAELVSPHLILQWHVDLAAVGQLLPVPAQFAGIVPAERDRSEEHTSELQSRENLV